MIDRFSPSKTERRPRPTTSRSDAPSVSRAMTPLIDATRYVVLRRPGACLIAAAAAGLTLGFLVKRK